MSASTSESLGVSRKQAARLAAMGRDGDSLLVHVNPRELDVLRMLGGRETENPSTGLLEFAPFDSTTPSPSIGAAPPVSTSVSPTTLQDQGAGSGSLYSQLLGASGQPAGSDVQDPSSGYWYSSSGAEGTTAGASDIYAPSSAPVTTPQVDPAQIAYYASVGQLGVGGNEDPLGVLEGSSLTGNPNFAQNPTTGYYDITPSGISGAQSLYAQETQSSQADIANSNPGILPFLAPLFPLAVGGAVAGLGALGAGGAVDAAGGAAADAGAAAADAGAAGGAVTDLGAAGAAGGAAADASTAGAEGLAGSTGALGSAALADPSTALGTGTAGDVATAGTDAGSTLTSLGGDANPTFLTTSTTESPTAAGGDLGSTSGGVGPSAAAISGPADAGSAGDSPLFDIQDAIAQAGTTAAGSGGFGSSALNWLTNGVSKITPIQALGAATSIGGLGYNLLKGNSGVAGNVPGSINTLNSQAAGTAAQGAQLSSYITSGTLPPALQTNLDQATQSAIAGIKSKYAANGIPPNSTMEQQDINTLQLQAQATKGQIENQLLSSGTALTNASASELEAVLNANIGLSNQTQTAISNLAAALAGGGNKIVLNTGAATS